RSDQHRDRGDDAGGVKLSLFTALRSHPFATAAKGWGTHFREVTAQGGGHLQLLVKLTRRARDVHAARNVFLAIFHALDHPGGLAAFGAIRTLGGVHDLFSVCGLCDLRHSFLLKCNKICPQTAAVPVSTFSRSKTQMGSGGARQREMHMSSAHAPIPHGAASTAGGHPWAPLSTRRVARLVYMSARLLVVAAFDPLFAA